jgi:hypothetical protein
LKKQLEKIERNPKSPAESSTERSTSTAQIEPKQQEQMEIDDIDLNFQTFTPSMEYQCTSPVSTTPLDNECITSQTFTPPMHSEFRQEQEQQQKEYLRPETYLQIYNKATVLR